MKKGKTTLKLLGIVALVAVIGLLTGCLSLGGAPNWDGNTPKADRVVLYYPESFQVEGVNGESKSLGPVTRVFEGKGGNWEKGKKAMQVPPGETTLRMAYTGALTRIYSDVAYDFLPAGHYRLIPSFKEGFSFGELMRITVAGTNQEVFNWNVVKIK